MILYCASFLIFCYVSASLFWKADCPLWVKLAGCGLILLISLKYEIYQFLGGAFFAPNLPRWLLLGLESCYGALLVLCFLLVLKDFWQLGNWLLARTGIPTGHPPLGIVKGCLAAVALACGIYGTWNAVRVPDVRTITERLPHLPAQLDGTSIIQLADLHVGPLLKRDWVKQVVEKVNATRPDIIALVGDYIDGHVADIGAEIAPFANLRAKYGIFGVTGNHEYYWNATAWVAHLRALGVDMLENEHRVVNIGGAPLVVAGVPDSGARRFGHEAPDIEKALAGAPETVRILLAHQPKNAPSWLEKADLMLSGHTHGGIMFFLQPLIASFNGGFVRGEYDILGKKLYVTPGTGIWNAFSARVGVPSEITRIILKSGAAWSEAEKLSLP